MHAFSLIFRGTHESDRIKLLELQAKNEKNINEGLYTSHEERESVRNSIEEQKKRLKKSENDLSKGLDNEPDIVRKAIKNRIDSFTPIKINEPVNEDSVNITKRKNKFRADRLSHLDRKQRKLLEKVYKVIKNILTPDEANLLIDEIEKELGYSNESA